jgi:hypothetical protein
MSCEHGVHIARPQAPAVLSVRRALVTPAAQSSMSCDLVIGACVSPCGATAHSLSLAEPASPQQRPRLWCRCATRDFRVCFLRASTPRAASDFYLERRRLIERYATVMLKITASICSRLDRCVLHVRRRVQRAIRKARGTPPTTSFGELDHGALGLDPLPVPLTTHPCRACHVVARTDAGDCLMPSEKRSRIDDDRQHHGLDPRPHFQKRHDRPLARPAREDWDRCTGRRCCPAGR